ncbi:hypothetical protein [Niveispirillum irakense]|uniref:hypothetical protein n=1 Tax=Niveispirillum irakense TaxID=34011 RepID=UPI0004279E77|nr:hypothetical protein [Niveispirillum irakense]
MIVTWLNIVSLLALAVCGSALILSGRRVMRVIREVERRLSRTVDEKNVVAAALRAGKKESHAIRDAIQEAEAHIEQLQSQSAQAEARLAHLRGIRRRTVNLLDREWHRFERLWCVLVINPSLGRQVGRGPGAGAWNEGREIYGFARTGEDFRQRLTAHYPPAEGFMTGHVDMIDLAGDEPGGNAVDLKTGKRG